MSDHLARHKTRPWYTGPARGLGALALGVCLIACQRVSGSGAPAADPGAADPAGSGLPGVSAAPPAMLAPGEEIELFEGSTLGMWKPEAAGAGSAVDVAEGAIRLGWGNPGTGVAWTGTPLPESFEIALEVMRVEGSGSGYWFLSLPIEGGRDCTLTLANAMAWLCGAPGSPDDGALTRNFGLDGGTWHSCGCT